MYCPAQRQSYVIEDTKNAKVKEFLAKGWFIDMKFWLPLATRQFYTLQHLTLFADDYRCPCACAVVRVCVHVQPLIRCYVQTRGVGQERLQDGHGHCARV